MPIGKNSITKRVATPQAPAKEEKIAPELVATVAAAPKTPTKKTASTTAKKPASSTAKKPAAKSTTTKSTTTKSATAKKPAATKKETLTPPTEPPKKVDTAVIANIAPETVAAVIGHKENTGFEKVQIGEKMPVHLL